MSLRSTTEWEKKYLGWKEHGVALYDIEYDGFHKAMMMSLNEDDVLPSYLSKLSEEERREFIEGIYDSVTSWLCENGVLINLKED